MSFNTVILIFMMGAPIVLTIWGIVYFIKKGGNIGHGTGFVGDAFTGFYAGQDKRKAIEIIRHEKEEKRHTGTMGEKYDDTVPPLNGKVEDQHDPDE